MSKIIDILCKLGIHASTCYTSAFWTRGVYVCNYCGGAGDKEALRQLKREGELWAQAPKELSPFEKSFWVGQRLH